MKDFFDTMKWRLILNIVLFAVIWTLLEFFLAKLIIHEAFQYNVMDHIIEPAGFAVLVTVGEYFYKKGKSK